MVIRRFDVFVATRTINKLFLCFNTFDTNSGTFCEVLSDKSDKFNNEITLAFFSACLCVKLSNTYS